MKFPLKNHCDQQMQREGQIEKGSVQSTLQFVSSNRHTHTPANPQSLRCYIEDRTYPYTYALTFECKVLRIRANLQNLRQYVGEIGNRKIGNFRQYHTLR